MTKAQRIAAEEFDHLVGITIHGTGRDGKVRQMDASMVLSNDRAGLRAAILNAAAPMGAGSSDDKIRETVYQFFRAYVIGILDTDDAKPRMTGLKDEQVQLVFDDEERNRHEQPLMIYPDQGENWYVYRSDVLHPTVEWATVNDMGRDANDAFTKNRRVALVAIVKAGWNGKGTIYGGVLPIPGTRQMMITWAVHVDPTTTFYASPIRVAWFGELVHEPPR